MRTSALSIALDQSREDLVERGRVGGDPVHVNAQLLGRSDQPGGRLLAVFHQQPDQPGAARSTPRTRGAGLAAGSLPSRDPETTGPRRRRRRPAGARRPASPSASRRPWAPGPRSHTARLRSTYCVVKHTVRPSAAIARNSSQKRARRIGSIPAVGSSTTRRSGSVKQGRGELERRNMPPLRLRASLRRCSPSSITSRTSRIRRRRVEPADPVQAGHEIEVLADGQVRIQGELLRDIADARAERSGQAAARAGRERRLFPRSGATGRAPRAR